PKTPVWPTCPCTAGRPPDLVGTGTARTRPIGVDAATGTGPGVPAAVGAPKASFLSVGHRRPVGAYRAQSQIGQSALEARSPAMVPQVNRPRFPTQLVVTGRRLPC